MSSPFLKLALMCCAVTALLAGRTLRFCADPDNLPFSNQARQGFENKIAELVADDLHVNVEFTWWSQKRPFVRNSLNAGKCDVIGGVAEGVENVLGTRPYYRSSYVIVSKPQAPVKSLLDQRLSSMRIGISVVGDGYTPPAQMLAARGLSGQLVGFGISGPAGSADPQRQIIDAVAKGNVDVAVVWGPLAGFFVKRDYPALSLAAIQPQAWAGTPFSYAVTMAVRETDIKLRDEINGALVRQCGRIQEILAEYAVPQALEGGKTCEEVQHSSSRSSR